MGVIQLLIMTELATPACNFDEKAHDFSLKGTDGKTWTLQDCAGPKGLLLMFICNHCPYVKSVIRRIVEDCKILQANGVGIIAVMSNDVNDPKYGHEDSFDNMKVFSNDNLFSFSEFS